MAVPSACYWGQLLPSGKHCADVEPCPHAQDQLEDVQFCLHDGTCLRHLHAVTCIWYDMPQNGSQSSVCVHTRAAAAAAVVAGEA